MCSVTNYCNSKVDLYCHADTVNELLARYGVKFGIYKNNTFHEQLFPFDAIPRVISADEFAVLERGLKQRVSALNAFIRDIYGEKKIVRDRVIPEEFIYSSSGYLTVCEGVTPPKEVYAHIAGIDLVQGKDGAWYILEDNLRVPSGASYPMIARELCRRASPKTFTEIHVEENRDYAQLLRHAMDHVNTGGMEVVLTPGRYNAAYFEHSYLAEQTGAHLVTGSELQVEDDQSYRRFYYLTSDHHGEFILRLLCEPDKKAVLDGILAEGLSESQPCWLVENDAMDGEEPVLFGYTCDMPRIRRFIVGLNAHGFKGTLYCFDFQEDAMQQICGSNVDIQCMDFEAVEQQL